MPLPLVSALRPLGDSVEPAVVRRGSPHGLGALVTLRPSVEPAADEGFGVWRSCPHGATAEWSAQPPPQGP